jgi:N-carbamoyl-L-amino-acid hydrolase
MPLSSYLDYALLHAQLTALSVIGTQPTVPGRTRLALSDADRLARDQLVAWLRAMDLTVHIDAVGNIYGILEPEPAYAHVPVLLIGSHIDTVIEAGAYDGCYGVLAGLAVLRALRAAGVTPPRPVGVVAFSNEEGVRFQPDMLGSLTVAGGMPVAAVLDLVSTDGACYGDELVRIGYAGPMVPGSLPIHAYLELHIEQGPILAASGVSLGAVHTLQGISWQRITLSGVANHAGTTPLHLRHDPLVVAAQVIAALRSYAVQSTATVATVGTLELAPSAINVIPHTVTFTLDLRDPDDAALNRAEAHLLQLLATHASAEGVTAHCTPLARFAPVVFDAGLVDSISAVARSHGISCMPIVSGAGHDAQMIARIAPSAMIFVPSRDGISHNPAEYTTPTDLEGGLHVLCDVVARQLGITVTERSN